MKPQDGGCWFCHGDDPESFSMEWDAYAHLSCAVEHGKKGNPEAIIMLEEWGEDTSECDTSYWDEPEDYNPYDDMPEA